MLPIQSKDNPRFRSVRGLLEQASLRRKLGQTVLEGTHLLSAYQQQGLRPQSIWLAEQAQSHPEVQALLQGWPDVPVLLLADGLYQQLRSLGPGVDVLAVIEVPAAPAAIDWQGDLLILDRVQDSGNVGTLLRSAAAAGFRTVLCTEGTASVWSPRVLRAGMGAQFGLSIHEHLNAEALLQQCQVPLLATSSHADQSLYAQDLRGPVGWLMGNEGQGVGAALLAAAQPVCIPQPGGQESLNVAVAGSVCLFETVRQRLMEQAACPD